MELHQKFYSKWYKPNGGAERVISCCSNVDCAPAEIKHLGSGWWGRRESDANWYHISEEVLEHNQPDPRESPDGRSHICVAGGRVICAVLGGGL